MAGEWTPATLGDLVTIKHGFAFQGEYFQDEPPGPVLVTPGNFNIGGGFNAGKSRYYLGDVPADFVLSPGDVIVTMTDLSKTGDTLGYSAVVPNDGRQYLHNQRIGKVVLRPEAPVNLQFASWLLRSPKYRSEILGSATGSTVRHTSPTRIAAFKFLLPTVDEQIAIANLLDALDDKIRTNCQIIKTLGGIARTLFNSWLIDFNPIRTNASGHPTGMSDDFVALFPDRFEDNGIPVGWKTMPLSRIAAFLNGLALQKYPSSKGEMSLPVIKIAELRTGPTEKSGRASKAIPVEYLVRNGDHLFSWSGSLTHRRWAFGEGALNQHLFKVTPLDGYPDWLVYYAVDYHLPAFQAIAAGKAVTMGHIQRHHLDEAFVSIPPRPLLAAMDGVMAPIHAKALTLELECRTLADLRDTLLPKLISGDLRIADKEKRIAAA